MEDNALIKRIIRTLFLIILSAWLDQRMGGPKICQKKYHILNTNIAVRLILLYLYNRIVNIVISIVWVNIYKLNRFLKIIYNTLYYIIPYSNIYI